MIAGNDVHSGRMLEWALAFEAMLLGAVILGPGASMDSPAYAALVARAPEWAFGALFFGAGLAHAAALWINGARARATTAARAAITLISVFAWAGFAVGFFQADPWSTAVPAYGGSSAAAAAAFYRACRDAMRARRPDNLSGDAGGV